MSLLVAKGSRKRREFPLLDAPPAPPATIRALPLTHTLTRKGHNTENRATLSPTVIARAFMPAAIPYGKPTRHCEESAGRRSNPLRETNCHCEESAGRRSNPPRETNPSLRARQSHAIEHSHCEGTQCPWQSQPRESNSCCTCSM